MNSMKRAHGWLFAWMAGGILPLCAEVPVPAEQVMARPPAIALPSEVDHSRSPHFPPFMDQGRVASCDWFACAYYQMSYTLNRMKNRPASPSTTFSPKFGFNAINNANVYPNNIWFVDIYNFLQRHGSVFLTDLPYDLARGEHYKEWVRDPELWRKAIPHRIAKYEFINFDVDLIKQHLAKGEVLVVQFDYNGMNHGRLRDDPKDAKDDPFVNQTIITSGKHGPDHTVALVGYNDHLWVDLNGDGILQAGEKGAFKLAESYREPAINDGFRWVSYQAVRNPQTTVFYENKAWRIEMREAYQPRLLAQVVLKHGQREKLKLQFGRSFSQDAGEARKLGESYTFEPYGLGFKPGASGKSLIEGGDCAFDGGKIPCEGGFTFDLTDLLAPSIQAEFWYFRLLNESDQPVSIQSFKLVDLERNLVQSAEDLPPAYSRQEKTVFIRLRR
jgi:hypothetical protein